MTYIRLKIEVSDSTLPSSFIVEEVSNLLIIAGVDTFTVEDYSDLEETLSEGGIFYDYIDEDLLNSEEKDPVIYAYFNSDAEGEVLYNATLFALDELKAKEGFSSLHYSRDEVKNEDWENNWRQYFKPFKVGERLVVKPTWEEVTKDLILGREVIEIDPSSSFGTGSHATTRLCMESLEKIMRGNERVLDMGCGSGILSIAALKLGAHSCVAVDIDEVAARIAKENVEVNGYKEDSAVVYDGDILQDSSLYEKVGKDYDIILANIVAGIIIMMAEMFYEKLKAGGTLIASGIISEREEEVKTALEKVGFKTLSSETLDDWSVIIFTK